MSNANFNGLCQKQRDGRLSNTVSLEIEIVPAGNNLQI